MNKEKASQSTDQAFQQRTLVERSGIGAAQLRAWEKLWQAEGRHGRSFIVRYVDLACQLCRSDRTARRLIRDLHEIGLIEIVDDLGRNGAARIFMLRPSDVLDKPTVSKSPQFELGFMEEQTDFESEPPATIKFPGGKSLRGHTEVPPDAPRAG